MALVRHGVAVLAALVLVTAGPALQARQAQRGGSAAAGAPLSADVRTMVAWIEQSGDNEGAPFIVIDKRRARLWLFDAERRLLGQTPVLLGRARGDASVPGIGERPIAQIRVDERTTPAGRFRAHAGRNIEGEDIFWIDYDAAVSMHRVRATNPVERRLERLASRSAADNRISYGCINVPTRFYDDRIQPLFGAARGVVYLLPEKVPFASLFVTRKPGAAPRGAAPVRPS